MANVKKYKIKKLKLSKVFLGVIMLMIVPVFGKAIVVLTRLANMSEVGSGVPSILLYSIFSLILYGLVGVTSAATYNWLSPKIGQFELELEETEVE